MPLKFLIVGLSLVAAAASFSKAGEDFTPDQVRVLFLGDAGFHKPAEKAQLFGPIAAKRNIQIVYTENIDDLNSENLAKYDVLLLYANIDRIRPAQEKALLDYVAAGGGFVPVHCASFCFRNSDEVVQLIGGQFQKHGTGEFRTVLADVDHEILRGFHGFGSWDETYLHYKHNDDNRTILEYRAGGEQAQGQTREPWSWVRQQGEGRVFYTAWGHDLRTWNHPGFQNLLERGIRWAAGKPVAVVPDYQEEITSEKAVAARSGTGEAVPFAYEDVGAKIPNYTPSRQWGVQGEPLSKMQKPLSPTESIKRYHLPDGFEMSLFASEPDIQGKPLAMCWDRQGRLYVCESSDYPNELAPPGQGHDRISILEDTDGDGKADKFTVFADKLSIPTAIVPWKDGMIVQSDGLTLFLMDTNGDGKADVRKVLISNWNMGDTHGCVSNFQYGLDNWIWAMQGYNNSTPEIRGVKQPPFRQGFFRFRLNQADDPEVEELEFVRSTNNNTWGIGISEEGIIFGSTANGNPSVYMPLANRYYERVYGMAAEQARRMAPTHLFQAITDKVRQVDNHGGYTAGAGHALYTARNYPQNWWNRTAFVCEPTGHLIGTFVLKPNGSDFTSELKWNLAASDDEWAAPIVAEVGPDGNVWMIDWYNFIIQHNPTPKGFQTGKGGAYESDLRDKTHGRIYRIHHTGGKALDASYRPSFVPAGDALACVKQLNDPTMLVRKQAQQAIIESGNREVKDELLKLLADQSVDALGLNPGATHAIWTLDGLGLISPEERDVCDAIAAATRHPSEGVRRNAFLVLPALPDQLAKCIVSFDWRNEPSGQAQLALLQAAADAPPNREIGKYLAALLTNNNVKLDRWQTDAATSACAMHAEPVLLTLMNDVKQQPDLASQILSRYSQLLGTVSRHLASERSQAPTFDQVVASMIESPSEFRGIVLNGLIEGIPKNRKSELSPETARALTAFFEQSDLPTRATLIRLTDSMGSDLFRGYVQEMAASYLKTLQNEDEPARSRIAAAESLVNLQTDSPDVVTQILDALTPRMNTDVAQGLLKSLEASRATTLATELLQRQQNYSPAQRAQVIDLILKRSDSLPILIEALEKRQLTPQDLTLEQKQALTNLPNRRLQFRAMSLLRAGGGLPDPDRAKVIEELHSVTTTKGSADAGRAVFTTHCAKCHQHGDLGTAIGPNLTGMAVHPKEELLIHILDPNRDVEGNFRTYTIIDKDGLVTTGMLATESRTTLDVIDNSGKKKTLQRNQIEELISSRRSLMPEGFEKLMTKEELTNLLEFLTLKGQYVPLDLRKIATISSDRDLFGPNLGSLTLPNLNAFTHNKVPFTLIDPAGGTVKNVVMLHGNHGANPPRMPREVGVTLATPVQTIHLLGCVSGWGYPATRDQNPVMTLRISYTDGSTEDVPLLNGIHFADYIRRIDVPESEFVTETSDGHQIRSLKVHPGKAIPITRLAFVKQSSPSAPIIMAITLELPK